MIIAPRTAFLAGAALIALLAVGAGGYWLGANRTPMNAASQSEDGRRVLYWYDPMVPDQHFDAPGQSPFMDMELVPRYADEGPVEAGVRIDPGVAQNLGVRLATVESEPVARSLTAAGIIAFSERSIANVQARSGGFVERTYGRAVGDVVGAGAPLVDIRVPDWAAAQAEYLALRGEAGELAAAARQRLVMLGMPQSLIERVEREGAARPVATIVSPVSGAITALDLRAGMTVAQGAPIASINGLSPVWLVVSLSQADAGLAQPGDRVVASVPAYPGDTFSGRVETILPAANAATRTIEVRIALANNDGRLRPGMTADAQLSERRSAPALMIPAEAVIRTGRRTLVIVAGENGRYAPTEIELGRRAGDRIEVRRGLSEGQNVVASGQFLIDSEANLSGALARLEASSSGQAATQSHNATGRVTALNGLNVTIAHGPVPSLQWPSMTMAFVLERPEQARGIAIGDTITFRFRQDGSRYVIVDIREGEARP
ncbi:MAG: efflux RND transporter periplasmic adaptor subunit [Hyphomonadaceae bacterium JAD_PAG50586_4]|nr:MAG: efflux RND transporter periplasmic adaptor subunit [Hyphomonadaceae bacterium JAD_PAG50586_4]